MEEALRNAEFLCPEYNLTDLIFSAFNITTFGNASSQLPALLCSYYNVGSLHVITIDAIIYIRIAMICLGLPSSILALLLFSTKPFRTVSFFYHVVINVLELIHILLQLEYILPHFTGENLETSTSAAWASYMTYVGGQKVENVVQVSVEIIVIIVAVERACMCNWPVMFNRINTLRVATTAILGSILGCFLLTLPVWFESYYRMDNETGEYSLAPTDFERSDSCRIYRKFMAVLPLVELIALSVASGLTVYGLWSMSQRKKRLIASSGPASKSRREQLEQIANNRELCILQVCETIPIVVSCAFQVYFYAIVPTAQPSLVDMIQMRYEDAISFVRLAKSLIVSMFVGVIIDAIGHSTHFYRYMVFAPRVRKEVKRILGWKSNVISA